MGSGFPLQCHADLLGKALGDTAVICLWNPRSSEVWSFNRFRSKFKCPSQTSSAKDSYAIMIASPCFSFFTEFIIL